MNEQEYFKAKKILKVKRDKDFGTGLSRGVMRVYMNDIEIASAQWESRLEHLQMIKRMGEFIEGRMEDFHITLKTYDYPYKEREKKPKILKEVFVRPFHTQNKQPFDWI
jgi:hypothetical protein